jgi:uncharacterized protein with NRDE domain
MCLAAFALQRHADFPLVLAANRDEFFARPCEPLAWWTHAQPDSDAADNTPRAILAGRDLRGGGTWLGLSPRGRLALLTNIRTGRSAPAGLPSRGEIVPAWLNGGEAAGALHTRMLARGHVDYNLITAEWTCAPVWHWSSSATGTTQAIDPGPAGHVFAVSNGRLDEPWPKLMHLRERLATSIDRASANDSAALIEQLFDALADERRAPDEQLPCTGVPQALESMLSSVFIRSADGRYGTRCSSVVLVQRGVGARVIERSFDDQGQVKGQVDISLPGWPHG